MKKIILSLYLVLISSGYCAYLKNVPQVLTQPNGKIIDVFATGDEYYNWLHDETNYTIVQDHSNGYYVYAKLENNELVPTKYIVGATNPQNTELEPGTNIDQAQVQQIRIDANLNNIGLSQNIQFKQYQEFYYITKGLLNNIVIFISFIGQDGWSETLEDYERLYNSPNEWSMYNYYQENSNNQLEIKSHFFPRPQNGKLISYVDPNPIDYYFEYDSITNPIGYQSGERWHRRQALMKSAIDFVKNEIIDSGIDIDLNSDNYIDAISFVVNNTKYWGGAFWPHVAGMSSTNTSIAGKMAYVYSLQSYLDWRLSVFLHEMGHQLGAPDLYYVLGPWDIMSISRLAGHFTTHVKHKYFNWFENIPIIDRNGTYTLLPPYLIHLSLAIELIHLIHPKNIF